MSRNIDDAAISSAILRTLALSREALAGSGPDEVSQSLRPMPAPELNDWASFSTFLRPLPFVSSVTDSNISFFEDGKAKYGASFVVRPLVPNADGKLGTLEVPPGKPLVLKSLNLPEKDVKKAFESGELSKETQQKLAQLCMEIEALSHPPLAAHRNIIKLLGFTQFPENKATFPSLILERAEYGTLDKFVSYGAFERYSIFEQNKLCADIADGLYAIHSCDIIHGDVKPGNILICRQEKTGFLAKIGDFGYSVVTAQGVPETNAGTDRWEAPELHCNENQMSKESDVYSFGLLAWYMFLGGHDPFEGYDNDQVQRMKWDGNKVVKKALDGCTDGIRRSILDTCLQRIVHHRDCAILSTVRTVLLQVVEDFEQSGPFAQTLIGLTSPELIRTSGPYIPSLAFLCCTSSSR
jgi:serine/threonine protein kinase